jgi:alkylated DNA repair dioxygenase AlkB
MSVLPDGLIYRPDFITRGEERELIAEIEQLEFGPVVMHGVTARRRVVQLGWLYGYESWRITPGPAMPGFLLPLRTRSADLIGLEPEALAEALVTEYPPGAGIGWHRDAPMFGTVVAVSLAGACRLRFQRGKGAERQTSALVVEPRSAYVLGGESREDWQHSIPATKQLRYSVTFRTLRGKAA